MTDTLLQVSGLTMRFGGLLAVNNVSLELNRGEIVSLIGPNGAGKTTIFNCLTGFYKPAGGQILLRGKPVQGLSGQAIARLGMIRTFQHVRSAGQTRRAPPAVPRSVHPDRPFLSGSARPQVHPASEYPAGSPYSGRSTACLSC